MGMRRFRASAKVPKAGAKVPNEANGPTLHGTPAKMPHQRPSAAERLRRLEEAQAFLRHQLAAGPQPARVVLKAAKSAGIATRTLHRAKDALGVRPERTGGYGAHGQWIWYPPGAAISAEVFPAGRVLASRHS